MSSSSVVPVRPHTGQAAVSGQQIPGRASNITLGVILICQLMVVLDATVVTIALPKIRYALDFSPTSLSWVQNAYTLTFGGFLLLGARAGDLLGRRRTLIAGITLFTISSLVGGLATNEAWLLTARAAQGLGGAIAAPATLALLTASFSEGAERLRALALYTAVSAGGASVGLVLGGIMTDWVSWRWALFINVPVGIALVLLAPRYLPESERHTGRFDLAGAITSTGGMGGLVYGFVRAASAGWRDPGTIGAFVLGIGLLATFVLVELRAEQPITPLRLLSSYERNASLVARLLTTGGMFGMFFFLTLYLQGALNYSPLRTGFAFVPMSAALFVTVRAIPKLMPRFGARPIMTIGSTLALVGMVWLTRINAHSGFLADLVGPMVVFG
ncbi:MAG TPA: MFS transporter, partial [Jatrophihabitans sp.]